MRSYLLAAFALALLNGSASAQFWRPKCPPVCPPGGDPYLTPPNMEGKPLPRPEDMMGQVPELNPNAFAQQSEGGGNAGRMFNDSFNGDFGGITCTCVAIIGTSQNAGNLSLGQQASSTDITRVVRLPAGTRYNGILNTDNDSPRPTTRIYFGYNYYQDINGSFNGDLGQTNLHRETVAFEYAFMDGNASVGMRLPFIQSVAPAGLSQSNMGDLSILFKYAFYNDRATGDIGSAGLIVTTPTAGNGNLTLDNGSELVLIDGTTLPTTSVLFQPWVGGVKMFERGYLQDMTGLLFSTDNREPVIFNQSVGAGFFLYQNPNDRFLKAIVPNVEAHLRVPLTRRDPNAAIFYQDQVNISSGVHFRSQRATLSPSINVPVVGPRAWNVEASVWLNFTF